jgi:hypothetical protein
MHLLAVVGPVPSLAIVEEDVLRGHLAALLL